MPARSGLARLAFPVALVVSACAGPPEVREATPPASPPAAARAPAPASAPASAHARPESPRSGKRPAVVRSTRPVDRDQWVELPDGTWAAALNGARGALRLAWPAGSDFSPIEHVTSKDGKDWYVHRDGSHSTTMMFFRADLGREDAVVTVARPAK